MSARRLSQVAAATGGRLVGADREFTRVTQDSRELAAGELFVAIRGANFDGHDFIAVARERGAAGALVEKIQDCDLPQVQVADARQALGAYAAHWRRQFSIPVIGVTGSSGKTTVKEMIASILRQAGPALATRGNRNNDIGVPLTLLELGTGQRAAVIEMGTNHPGEIAYLARLTRAEVGVVVNAGPAHIEFLGSVEGVAKEKGALFAELAPQGVAVINADDRYAPLWREMAGARRQLSFGFSADADFHPQAGSLQLATDGGWSFRLVSPAGTTDIGLSLPGRHNVANALAAAATTVAAGASLAHVAAGLAQVPVTAGRLVLLPGVNGSRLIDDTYNANPLSLRAAMEFAASLGGRAWLALGDMGELGPGGAQLHAESGAQARALGIEKLFALGDLSAAAVSAFGPGARHFADLEALLDVLRVELASGVTLLVKGSRAMRMERVVQALRLAPAPDRAANGD